MSHISLFTKMHFTRKTSLRPAGVTVWSTEIQSISPWEIKLDELSCIELKNDKIQSGKRTIVSFTIVFGCHIHFFVFSKRLFRCSLYLSNITLSTGAFELVDCDVVLQFLNCLTGNFLPLCGKVKKNIVIVVNIQFCYVHAFVTSVVFLQMIQPLESAIVF